MDFVVVLHHVDRSGVQQIFGPYGSESLANKAMGELKGWPTLRGEWEVRPLTRHGDTTPPAPSTPVLPYAPPHTHPAPFVWPPRPWPYQDRIVWCGTSTDRAGTWTLTTTRGANYELDPGHDDDGTAGVPARV